MSKTLRSRSWLAVGVSAGTMIFAAPTLAQTGSGAGSAPGGVGVQAPSTTPAQSSSELGAPPATNVTPNPGGSVDTRTSGVTGQPSTNPVTSRTDTGTVIEELIVTAQKREESIQSVPIAVSAFSADSLKASRIEGGRDLLLQVPNVNFSDGQFGGFNFQIRGIGAKLVAKGAEGGIGIHENNVPLSASRLADSDFYDVERVEVLRGPQGTLFGRNATGGVVNIITAKPTDRFAGSLTGELADYNSYRFTGFANVPIGDTLAVRFAGFHLDRNGYGLNDFNHDRIDGRNIFSGRVTVAWHPIEKLHVTLLHERFVEDDSRARVLKQLCIKDTGTFPFNQGCKPGSLYDSAQLQTPFSESTLAGLFGTVFLGGFLPADVTPGLRQDPNLRNIASYTDPTFKAHNNLTSLNLEYDITPHLKLISLSSYDTDDSVSRTDYNRVIPTVPYNQGAVSQALTAAGYYGPNGIIDPQLGTSNLLRSGDEAQDTNRQVSSELRLQSSFRGPLNFNLGAIYINYTDINHYYVFANTLTAYAVIQNLKAPGCPPGGAIGLQNCIFIDPTQTPTNGIGHSYYDSFGPIELTSEAAFGELYYNLRKDLKITIGARYTDDEKATVNYPVNLETPGYSTYPLKLDSGAPKCTSALPVNCQANIGFRNTTGRANIEWTPKLPFTNQTTIYASYTRGYKAGGFNPPSSVGVTQVGAQYAPEFIDSYEIGTKNTLLNGSLVLNLTGFYYNYTGYQISRLVNRSVINDNLNAHIRGVEFEGIWEPIRHLRFNANVGYLDTNITGGSLVDVLNRTQGNPNLIVAKNAITANNCVLNATGVGTFFAATGPGGAGTAPFLCGGPGTGPGSYFSILTGALGLPAATAGQLAGAAAATGVYNYGAGVTGDGVGVNLNGKNLPNSPHETLAVGGQYTLSLPYNWAATVRADYYYQGESFSRVFNAVSDKLRSYDNLNLSLNFANREQGLSLQFFVKNAFDNVVITDTYLSDDSTGLFTNIFLNEPRQLGVSLTKTF